MRNMTRGSKPSLRSTCALAVQSRLHESYPDVLIELVTGSTSRMFEMVQRYEVNAAFITEPFHAPEQATQAAFDEEAVIIAARSVTKVLDKEHLR